MTTEDLKALTHKVCNVCNQDLPIEKFWHNNTYPDSRWKYCNTCARLARITSPHRKENGGTGRPSQVNKLRDFLAGKPGELPSQKTLKAYIEKGTPVDASNFDMELPFPVKPTEVVSIQVTDSVPIPDEALQFVYPFETMKVGDSFGFSEGEYGQVLRALTGTATTGASYYTSPDKLRCWRVR